MKLTEREIMAEAKTFGRFMASAILQEQGSFASWKRLAAVLTYSFCAHAGISQNGLAFYLHISASSLSRWREMYAQRGAKAFLK